METAGALGATSGGFSQLSDHQNSGAEWGRSTDTARAVVGYAEAQTGPITRAHNLRAQTISFTNSKFKKIVGKLCVAYS